MTHEYAITLESRLKTAGLPKKEQYSCPEVAKILQTSYQFALSLVNSGQLPLIRLGTRTRHVPAKALEDFIEKSYIPAGTTS